MRELTLVELWEHFCLDPATAVWWYNDAEPMRPPPTSGGVTRARIAAMEPLDLYQTIRRDPCLYGALKHKCTVVLMCDQFGLSPEEFGDVRKWAHAAPAKANARLARTTWTSTKEVRLAAVVSAVAATADRATMKASAREEITLKILPLDDGLDEGHPLHLGTE